ncbi:ribonuclease H-like domain-containing protein [Syncephalis plumigaleata]|nr:ribonuclease H-like domain-containing protein [Syncephalis plumigaleata]
MSQQLLRRPGYGKAGRPIQVLANHYTLTSLPKGNLIHFDVKISTDKEVKEKETKRQVIAQLQVIHKSKLGKAVLAYDGMATAFSPHPLAVGDALSVEVTLPESGGGGGGAYYSGKLRDPDVLLKPIMALEVLLGHMASSRFLSIGRSLYTGEDCMQLPGGLDAWRGYTLSVRPGESNLMLNINTTTRPSIARVHCWTTSAQSRIKVHVTHRQGIKPRCIIDKLTPKGASDTVFNVGETGQTTNVAAYFAKQYNYRLRYPQLPCIVTKKKTFFPLEVCMIEPNQRVPHQLSDIQLAAMINLVGFNRDATFKQFNMAVDTRMVSLTGRVLDAPRFYTILHRVEMPLCAKGRLVVTTKQTIARAGNPGSWAVVVFSQEKFCPRDKVRDFFTFMERQFIDKGINVQFRAAPQLIFVVFSKTTDLYGKIKKVAETKLGLITQGMRSSHIYKKNAQYCGNMSLKVNKKLGGTNCKLADRSIPILASEPTIIMGADVSHPTGSASRHGQPSIATVCGSLDLHLSNYDGTYRTQEDGEMTKEILINFRRKSGHEPKRIIFYRDGVSDGIKQACRQLSANYNPKLTFIVAKKRHHTRFFASQPGPQTTDNSAHAGIQGTCNPVHYVVLYDENKMEPDTVQEMTNRMSYTFSRCTRSVSLVPAVYWAHVLADRARHYVKEDIASDTGSMVSTSTSTSMAVQPYVPIANNLRTQLFFT